VGLGLPNSAADSLTSEENHVRVGRQDPRNGQHSHRTKISIQDRRPSTVPVPVIRTCSAKRTHTVHLSHHLKTILLTDKKGDIRDCANVFCYYDYVAHATFRRAFCLSVSRLPRPWPTYPTWREPRLPLSLCKANAIWWRQLHSESVRPGPGTPLGEVDEVAARSNGRRFRDLRDPEGGLPRQSPRTLQRRSSNRLWHDAKDGTCFGTFRVGHMDRHALPAVSCRLPICGSNGGQTPISRQPSGRPESRAPVSRRPGGNLHCRRQCRVFSLGEANVARESRAVCCNYAALGTPFGSRRTDRRLHGTEFQDRQHSLVFR